MESCIFSFTLMLIVPSTCQGGNFNRIHWVKRVDRCKYVCANQAKLSLFKTIQECHPISPSLSMQFQHSRFLRRFIMSDNIPLNRSHLKQEPFTGPLSLTRGDFQVAASHAKRAVGKSGEVIQLLMSRIYKVISLDQQTALCKPFKSNKMLHNGVDFLFPQSEPDDHGKMLQFKV